MTTADLIAIMVKRIAEKFKPDRIILFGSQARGDTNESSDVDLLIVLKYIPNKHETAVEIRHSVMDVSISKDIIVATPDEIERDRDIIGTTAYEAFQEGKIMYEKK